MRGLLIAFEGLDQSGKQTQAELLRDHLKAAGHRVRMLSFPDYGTSIGEEIARALQGERDYGPDVMQLLYVANRYERKDEIQQWIEGGLIIICDRYRASSVAYGEAFGLDPSWLTDMQKYLPAAMALLAPNVNSYRRISRFQLAPINVQWGYDNRTAGLRVPASGPEARRVENRLAGADANPYIAIATSLACGYLGMIEGLQPSEPISGSAHELPFSLPRSLDDAIRELRIRSGSRHSTIRPSFVSSIGSQRFASTYSRFRFFSRSIGLMRSGLKASYGTPKNLASAAPIAGILTWNSSLSTCSTSIAFLRAWRAASSNSPADSTASAIK